MMEGRYGQGEVLIAPTRSAPLGASDPAPCDPVASATRSSRSTTATRSMLFTTATPTLRPRGPKRGEESAAEASTRRGHGRNQLGKHGTRHRTRRGRSLLRSMRGGDTSLDGTSPDDTSPDGTSPDGTSPDGTSPDDTSPRVISRSALSSGGSPGAVSPCAPISRISHISQISTPISRISHISPRISPRISPISPERPKRMRACDMDQQTFEAELKRRRALKRAQPLECAQLGCTPREIARVMARGTAAGAAGAAGAATAGEAAPSRAATAALTPAAAVMSATVSPLAGGAPMPSAARHAATSGTCRCYPGKVTTWAACNACPVCSRSHALYGSHNSIRARGR